MLSSSKRSTASTFSLNKVLSWFLSGNSLNIVVLLFVCISFAAFSYIAKSSSGVECRGEYFIYTRIRSFITFMAHLWRRLPGEHTTLLTQSHTMNTVSNDNAGKVNTKQVLTQRQPTSSTPPCCLRLHSISAQDSKVFPLFVLLFTFLSRSFLNVN